MTKVDFVNLKLRVSPRQRERLHEVAAERGMTLAELMRIQIQAVTGVKDDFRTGRVRNGERKRKAKVT